MEKVNESVQIALNTDNINDIKKEIDNMKSDIKSNSRNIISVKDMIVNKLDEYKEQYRKDSNKVMFILGGVVVLSSFLEVIVKSFIK